MLVFYIRHNWSPSEFSGLNQRLFDSKKICIHYEDVVNPSTESNIEAAQPKQPSITSIASRIMKLS